MFLCKATFCILLLLVNNTVNAKNFPKIPAARSLRKKKHKNVRRFPKAQSQGKKEHEFRLTAHHYIPKSALEKIYRLLAVTDYERFVKILNQFIPQSLFNILPSEKTFSRLSVNLFYGPIAESRINDPGNDIDPIRSIFEVDSWPRSIVHLHGPALVAMKRLWNATQNAMTVYFACFERTDTDIVNEKLFPEIEELFNAFEAALYAWSVEKNVKISFSKKDALLYNPIDWHQVFIWESGTRKVYWSLIEDPKTSFSKTNLIRYDKDREIEKTMRIKVIELSTAVRHWRLLHRYVNFVSIPYIARKRSQLQPLLDEHIIEHPIHTESITEALKNVSERFADVIRDIKETPLEYCYG